MKKFLFLGYFLIAMTYGAGLAQAGTEDLLVGVFANKQAGLVLSVKGVSAGVYEGFFEYQGQRYTFSGVKLLGMLSGEYAYQGNMIGFSLARILGVYYVTSDGNSIEVERTSATPLDSGKSPAGNPVSAPAPAETSVSAQAPAATGSRINDPYGLFSFQLPASWTHTMEQGNQVITKSNLQAQLGVVAHNYSSLQEIRNNAFDVRDAESNTFLKATTQNYGANSVFIRYEGQAQGQSLVIEMISVLSPYGGGANVVGTALAPNYKPEITAAIKSIANSLQFLKPGASPVAQQWKQRINGKQLLYLYTGNGLSDKITMDLCASGRFAYYSNSSYMSGGHSQFSYAGRDSNSGTWKVLARNNQAVLVLFYDGGNVEEYELSNRQAGNEIGLNGKRYFIQNASCN